jgi:polygalacturonase
MKNLNKLLFFLLLTVSCVVFSQNNSFYNISDYGAIGDFTTNNTKIIQSTIDLCSKAGGGTVIVPPGTYMSGALFLKNNVILNLVPGSELRAIPDLNAFPIKMPGTPSNFNIFFRRAFIFAENVNNIGITGQGIINGQGHANAFKQTTWKVPDRYQNRPGLIRFVNCKNIRIENVKLINSAFWTLHFMASSDIVVHGISLISRTANFNNDGIDIDGCENVRISDCYINSLDDAISIKGTGNNPTKRIMINNCLLSSHCNAVRVGAENFAGFEDIHFSNCHIFNSSNGITFQNIDGFKMKRISFKGIAMYEVGIPIYVITGRKIYPIGVPEEEYPCQPGKYPASIEDLMFDNISGNNIGYYQGVGTGGDTVTRIYRDAIILSGHKDAPLVRCSMNNINFHFNGGGSLDDNNVILPEVNNLPNPTFESTPAYGIITRNTNNLKMTNINLSYEEEDKRSAIIVENGMNTMLKNISIQSDGTLPGIKWIGIKPYTNNCSEIIENNIKSISESDIMELKKFVFVEN